MSDLREQYEERAAIIEFDGNVHRTEAERLAREQVFGNSMKKAQPAEQTELFDHRRRI